MGYSSCLMLEYQSETTRQNMGTPSQKEGNKWAEEFRSRNGVRADGNGCGMYSSGDNAWRTIIFLFPFVSKFCLFTHATRLYKILYRITWGSTRVIVTSDCELCLQAAAPRTRIALGVNMGSDCV